MITIRRYDSAAREQWNGFIDCAKNGHFMFRREYMEYHADRFSDHSLLCWDGDSLVAVVPGCEIAGSFYSHAGLTFGGVVTTTDATQATVLDCVEAIIQYSRIVGWQRLFFKALPHIFSRQPADEFLFAIHHFGGSLFRRDVGSAVFLPARLPYRNLNQRGINKGTKAGLRVLNAEFSAFWPILEDVLAQRHGTRPVHTLAEIELLGNRFPDAIRCYCAYQGNVAIAGMVLFVSGDVAHTQYLAASEVARSIGGLNFLIDWCLRDSVERGHRYFSFGISTENDGTNLNSGLIFYKEGFGARSIVFDQYELCLDK